MDSTTKEPIPEGFNRQVQFIEVAWFVLAGAFVFLILAYWYSFSKYGWSTNPDAWGQFGDFLGGVLNPLVSLAALFALVISVRMQRSELNDTRAELVEARKVATEQAKTADQQRREQRFFDLLNLYQRTVDSLTFTQRSNSFLTPVSSGKHPPTTNIFHGKAAIEWLSGAVLGGSLLNFCKYGFFVQEKNQYCSMQNLEKLTETWKNPLIGNFIDQYFRVIYRILSEAETLLGEDHYRYVKLLRAQLNRNELTLLAYNMWLDEEGIKMRPLAEKYGLLKHLPAGKLREQVQNVFPYAVFGKRKEMQ
jgi:Putative phage abortive infection protein